MNNSMMWPIIPMLTCNQLWSVSWVIIFVWLFNWRLMYLVKWCYIIMKLKMEIWWGFIMIGLLLVIILLSKKYTILGSRIWRLCRPLRIWLRRIIKRNPWMLNNNKKVKMFPIQHKKQKQSHIFPRKQNQPSLFLKMKLFLSLAVTLT